MRTLCSVPTKDFSFLRHDYRVDDLTLAANEFDVAASLARLNETCSLKSELDLAEGFGLSRPNLDLDGPYSRRSRGPRRLKMQFKRLF